MMALCVKQPWASLIAQGFKPIETRTWPTDYRGPLLIVASKTPDREAMEVFQETLSWAGMKTIPYGQAVCRVDLADCRFMTKEDEIAACCTIYPLAWAWVFKNIVPVEPFPVHGKLKLFEVEMPC